MQVKYEQSEWSNWGSEELNKYNSKCIEIHQNSTVIKTLAMKLKTEWMKDFLYDLFSQN